MPQSGGNIKRPHVNQEEVDLAIDALQSKLSYRLTQKGSDSYASKHEILGILEEEMTELKEEIRIDTQEGYDNFAKELLDIAVGAAFGYACIKAGLVAPSQWELAKEEGDPAARSLDEQHERFIQMINDAETEKLRAHIASADAVVQGRVVSTKRASEPNPPKMSEHDPDWHVAIIRIEQSLKGKHKDEIAVRFPKSRDIKWYLAPKLKEGQEGVFVLHRDGLELGSALLALIHPEDLLPGGGRHDR